MYFCASSIRLRIVALSSKSPFFDVNNPNTAADLSLGKKRKGSKSPERSSSYSKKNPPSCSWNK